MAQLGIVNDTARLFAFFGRAMDLLAGRTSVLDQYSEQVVDGGFHTRPYIVGALCFLTQHHQVCLYDVINEYKIPCLSPIAVDDGLFIIQHFLDENGDDTRLSFRVLAWPVDIGVAEIDDLETADSLIVCEILLCTEFTQSVGRQRFQDM